jgi:hypothetical protein
MVKVRVMIARGGAVDHIGLTRHYADIFIEMLIKVFREVHGGMLLFAKNQSCTKS